MVNPLTTLKTYFCKDPFYYHIPPLMASSLQMSKPNFCMHLLCSKIWVQISSFNNERLNNVPVFPNSVCYMFCPPQSSLIYLTALMVSDEVRKSYRYYHGQDPR
jgi:hypothetical protein